MGVMITGEMIGADSIGHGIASSGLACCTAQWDSMAYQTIAWGYDIGLMWNIQATGRRVMASTLTHTLQPMVLVVDSEHYGLGVNEQ